MTFYTKSILSLILLGSTLLAFFTMFELMGRKEKRFNPKLLRTVHRVNGYCFLILFIIISYYCLKIMRAAGIEPSPRVTLHALLAVATFLFLLLKLSIALFYRQYLAKVAPLGIGVVLLALATTASSAGYYFTMRGGNTPVVSSAAGDDGDLNRGSELFSENCSDCHYTDQTDTKVGPGLKGLFELQELPKSGRPVTEANVRKQLLTPFEGMPAFQEFSPEEMEALLAYLKTL